MSGKPISKAQRDLKALRERVASIATTLPDVVWSVAIPSLKIVYVNPAVDSLNEQLRPVWRFPAPTDDKSTPLPGSEVPIGA